MLRTNKSRLPSIAIQGSIYHPMVAPVMEFSSDANGFGHSVMNMGGIVYNVNIGDLCMGMYGDHVEPCVSTKNLKSEMTYQDQLLVKAYGRGLKLLDYPDIAVMNLDPHILEQMVIAEEDDAIVVPVTKRIPSYVMGSGVGQNPYTGDYDLMTSDRMLMHKPGLDDLRYGDIVALQDADNTFGRGYLKGAFMFQKVTFQFCQQSGKKYL